MNFSYEHQIKDGYMIVTSQGSPETPEDFFEYIKSSLLKARANDLSCVIFDESAVTLDFKVYDAVLMSDQLEREGLQTLGIRAAVICNSQALKACKYFETPLRNRSFNVMMFENLREGKSWLLGE